MSSTWTLYAVEWILIEIMRGEHALEGRPAATRSLDMASLAELELFRHGSSKPNHLSVKAHHHVSDLSLSVKAVNLVARTAADYTSSNDDSEQNTSAYKGPKHIFEVNALACFPEGFLGIPTPRSGQPP